MIHGTKNGEREKAIESGQEMNKREKERKKNIAQTLCVLSLFPNDMFAHSFEHVPGINISSCRPRERSLDGFSHLFHLSHGFTCRINRK